jgi:YD repeat-containing protein
MRDANNNATTSSFDPLGRQLATTDSNGYRTTQVYDPIGQRVALINARGNRSSFVYDPAGQQTRLSDPLGRRTSYGFDGAGRRVQRTDARAYRTTYSYDDADRLVGWRYPDGSRVTLVYDPIGQRTVLSDTTGRTTVVYDKASRLSTVTTPAGKRLSYSYDGLGERTLLIEPGGGRFSYVWDKNGHIDHLTNPQVQRSSWAYDAADRETSQRLANGIRVSLTYDAADRLGRRTNLTATGATISSFAYRYDPAGNCLVVTEADGTRVSWAYDSINRLTRDLRSGGNGYALTYTYDPMGNRLSKREGGSPTTYAYDLADELLTEASSLGTTTHSYDRNGNQIRKVAPGSALTTLAWDFENRLVSALLPTGIRNTFTYNADGQRVQKVDSSGTIKYIWDLENDLRETDQNDVKQVIYTLEPKTYGKIVSQLRGGTASYAVFDGLASTDQLTDSSGAVTDSYTYQALGVLHSGSGTTLNSFRYLGGISCYYDPDLLDYYIQGMYYDPTLGRLVTSSSLLVPTPKVSYTTACFSALDNPVDMFPKILVAAVRDTKRALAARLFDCTRGVLLAGSRSRPLCAGDSFPYYSRKDKLWFCMRCIGDCQKKEHLCGPVQAPDADFGIDCQCHPDKLWECRIWALREVRKGIECWCPEPWEDFYSEVWKKWFCVLCVGYCLGAWPCFPKDSSDLVGAFECGCRLPL